MDDQPASYKARAAIGATMASKSNPRLCCACPHPAGAASAAVFPRVALTNRIGDNPKPGHFRPRGTVLYDNDRPRYLPHMQHPQVLHMGLAPLGAAQWIETDNHLGAYHEHKLQQRARLGEQVCRATPGSLSAREELAALLLEHLLQEQADIYECDGATLHCRAGGYSVPIDGDEPLWNCSLWVADDLVIMEKLGGEYRLTAASLCSPSHWRLRHKFDRSMRAIHDPIPGFHDALSARIDRFFEHLKPQHPVTRSNWALQDSDLLYPPLEEQYPITAATPLYYRSERQTLVRLPRTGAIAFTIRVYLHPLASLRTRPGALAALFAAIDLMPLEIACYKDIDRLAPALASWRQLAAEDKPI